MKTFLRRKNDSLLGGVCTGIIDYFDLSDDWLWIIRLIFILFLSKISIIFYLLLWGFTKED